MGKFDRRKEKQKKSEWITAVRGTSKVYAGRIMVGLASGERTILPKNPWKDYQTGENAPQECYMLLMRNDERGYYVIGHGNYDSTIKKLEEYILDSDETSILVRELTLEEVKSLVEVESKRDNYFKYVGELSDQLRDEIEFTFRKAIQVFQITNPEDGRAIATQVMEIVDDILKTGKFPEAYDDMVDIAVALGVLFGQALCVGYGWSWKRFGESESDSVYGVVSPEENFCNASLLYLNKILSGQNIGLDGNNDNTVLLLYNMLENIDQKPEDKKYVPLA